MENSSLFEVEDIHVKTRKASQNNNLDIEAFLDERRLINA